MNKKEVIISCIGTSLLQPIIDLTYTLSKMEFSGDSLIKVSSNENGYSSNIVIGTVLCMESLLNNLKYRNSHSDRSVLNFFKNKYPLDTDLYEDLEELFTLRDAITHNHIWKMSFRYDENYNEIDIQKELLSDYGNQRFFRIVDMVQRETKKLGLRIIPIRVGCKEVKIAFNVLKKFSDFLDNQKLPFISNEPYNFGEEMLSLDEINDKLNSTF